MQCKLIRCWFPVSGVDGCSSPPRTEEVSNLCHLHKRKFMPCFRQEMGGQRPFPVFDRSQLPST